MDSVTDLSPEQAQFTAAFERHHTPELRLLVAELFASVPDGDYGIVQAIAHSIAEARASVECETLERLSLERRVAELEARPAGVTYRGVWENGNAYSPGDLATDRGSLWHCREETNSRPGSSSAWKLMVKSARAE